MVENQAQDVKGVFLPVRLFNGMWSQTSVQRHAADRTVRPSSFESVEITGLESRSPRASQHKLLACPGLLGQSGSLHTCKQDACLAPPTLPLTLPLT
jgi:hypothetical protein